MARHVDSLPAGRVESGQLGIPVDNAQSGPWDETANPA